MRFMRTMLWMGMISLWRDRVVMLLTFALPIAFFSIFVGIFGGMVSGGGGGTSKVKVAVVDEDQSDGSKRFVAALKKEESLLVWMGPKPAEGQTFKPYDRAAASALVKEGNVGAAVVIPRGFGATFGTFGGDAVPVDLIQDAQRDPIAPQMVAGLMQKAAMMGAPDVMIEKGLEQFDKYAGGLTDQQRAAMDKWLPMLREDLDRNDATRQATGGAAATAPDGEQKSALSGFQGMVRVNTVNVHQEEHSSDWEAFVSFQVAQVAVMFLLFSMSGGAGSLLEEQDNGTLERMLSSNMGMTGLLLGKWFFIALIGVVQLTIMFLWAWKPFGLNLWTPAHVSGFAIMTLVTAAAGAAFGMVLATMCRTRGQLGGLSTIIILVMSAVGGSMFPRFMMSDTMQEIGKWTTFNAWALDGYRKVFYDNAPLWQLWPQVAVLAGMTIAFLLIARRLARRWEAQ